jgi:hypothetical protein
MTWLVGETKGMGSKQGQSMVWTKWDGTHPCTKWETCGNEEEQLGRLACHILGLIINRCQNFKIMFERLKHVQIKWYKKVMDNYKTICPKNGVFKSYDSLKSWNTIFLWTTHSGFGVLIKKLDMKL